LFTDRIALAFELAGLRAAEVTLALKAIDVGRGITPIRRLWDQLAVRRQRRDACANLVHGGINSSAEGSGVTNRIAGQSGGVNQTYDGWQEVSGLNFSNGVESGYSIKGA
jgi:hypothetical protein